ncbi:MAG: bifunctional folylpolyglutamate synthase/dihydrofolate synthase [Planctomycetes bacterium]|nr:bifunctional folylpolyglutamate synthase/dihydrofolate synthase [Planctomycetota bacterium]
MLYTKLKSYSDAYQYLCRFTDYERMAKVHYSQTTYNLKRMKWLLQALGNPQNNLHCIHIAGTKGKGSTALMIARILSSAGYRTGLYTSPHLVDLRERIQLWHNDKQTLIPKNDFTNLMNHIADKTHFTIRHSPFAIGSPTFFETMTAMAFLYFTQHKVDFAVIEVGLGGRLDATNLITPIASVITRVDLDHTDKLGDTIKEIAHEKAGIIKPGVPVITFRQMTPADKVIKESAKAKKAPLHLAKILPHKLNLLGNHQQENYSLACGAIKLLNSANYTKINTAEINRALKELVLPGRLELVSRKPDPVRGRSPLGDRESVTPNSTLPKDNNKETVSDKIRFTSNGADIILDSAHNPVSIKATIETIQRLKYRKIILVLALSKDKDVKKILDIITPSVDVIILTKTSHPRLLEPNEFLKYLPENTDQVFIIEPEHKRALEKAVKLAAEDDLILITGSFYLAGEIKRIFNTNHTNKDESYPSFYSG